MTMTLFTIYGVIKNGPPAKMIKLNANKIKKYLWIIKA